MVAVIIIKVMSPQ